MDATPFEAKPTLTGELVTLRPIRAEDAHVIDALIRSDPEIDAPTPAPSPREAPTACSAGWPAGPSARPRTAWPSSAV